MAGPTTAKFHNDMGVEIIEIGSKEFECIGAKPPFDHPHVYLEMGNDDEIICPYCSTLYRHNDTLSKNDAIPEQAKLAD